MTWMAKWAGGHPLFAARARGAAIEDVDGHRYVDFALGDTGAMAGHSPPPVVDAGRAAPGRARRRDRDAADRGRDLGRRRAGAALRRAAVELRADARPTRTAGRCGCAARSRGARTCSCSATATTAPSTRRSSRSTAAGARARARATSGRRSTPPSPRACASSTTSRPSSALLADEQVACVLTEPALTNIGIVLPEDGFLDGAARRLRPHGHAADHRRDAHAQRGPGRLHRRVGRCSPTSSRSARRSPAACRSAPTASAPTSPRASRRSRTPTSSTSAASAGRSPATRCRSPRRARRSARC